MSKYCSKCGIKVVVGVASMFAESKTYEFEDGVYCENCAKIRVAEARK